MSISLELEKFCNWFEGEFDNWTQAASNPTKWAHIVVTHKKIGDTKFDTSSRYEYQTEPYRQQVVEIIEPEIVGANIPIIIVKNTACDIIFSYDKDDDCFVGVSEQNCTYKGKPLSSKARLYATQYNSWDKGYWEGAEGYFLFQKKL